MPQQITGHFTCDNSYSVWVGNANSVVTKLLEATNPEAADIAHGGSAADKSDSGRLPLHRAWSDDERVNGLLGSFTGAVTVHTGDPAGAFCRRGGTKGTTNFRISTRSTRRSPPPCPTDWVVPFVGAPNVLPLSPVERGTRYQWHRERSLLDVARQREGYPAEISRSPYVPFAGFNHDEFLIFRIPFDEFEPTTPGNITYNCEASTHCGPGRLCFDYSLPTREGPPARLPAMSRSRSTFTRMAHADPAQQPDADQRKFLLFQHHAFVYSWDQY